MAEIQENFLVFNENEARMLASLLHYTEEDIQAAKNSEDGLIKRVSWQGVNDGSIPIYICKMIA